MNDVKAGSESRRGEALRALDNWVRAFLMRPNPALGRSGDVCPFTAQAARLDTARLGVSNAGPGEAARIAAEMRECFTAFESIPAARSMRHFRTILVAFPGCNSEDGIAALKEAQKQLKFHALSRARMLGLFHPQTEDTGLHNPAFRPLRAPFPVLAIREIVEQDAPFALRHPLLVPFYLARFPVAGSLRLLAHLRAARRPKPNSPAPQQAGAE